jgi:MFS family permease
MLVAGRVVQGFGGGGVVVLVHVCVSDLFSIRYVFHRFASSSHDLGIIYRMMVPRKVEEELYHF